MQISWHSEKVEKRGAEEEYGREPGGGEDKNPRDTSHVYSSFLPRMNAKAPVGGTLRSLCRSEPSPFKAVFWDVVTPPPAPPGFLDFSFLQQTFIEHLSWVRCCVGAEDKENTDSQRRWMNVHLTVDEM